MARIGATNNFNTGLRIGSTGAENTIGVEGRGGNLTGDVTSGAKKMFAVGDYARALGVKPGTAVDLSSYDPATVKAVQELAWKKNKQAADENKAKLKKTAIIIGAAALGGAALGAAGGAAGATAAPGAVVAAPTAATTAGAGSGIGASTYLKGASAALQAANSYSSAKEQEKVAKEAGKPKDTARTPYGNEYIRRLMAYILQEQQRVYNSRMRGYGAQPGDYSPFAALLSQVPSNYSGVG